MREEKRESSGKRQKNIKTRDVLRGYKDLVTKIGIVQCKVQEYSSQHVKRGWVRD